jgi:hydroxymethylpyrimidine/phosphomethylpyrimidine kinase
MAAATTITFQNTQELTGRFDLPASAVRSQLEAIFADRVPNAVKTGALGTADTVRAVGLFLTGEFLGPLVIDPLTAAGSGGSLLDEGGIEAILEYLLPGAAMVTPNVEEAEKLVGFEVFDIKDAEAAALRLVAMGARSALVTGSKVVKDGVELAADVFCDGEEIDVLTSPWVEGLRVHGTGCLLSAAVTACLARGMALSEAVGTALSHTAAGIEGAVLPGRGVPCANPWAWDEAGPAEAGETPGQAARSDQEES